MSLFKKATKEQAKIRLALQGPSGGGKTYSALAIGTAMGRTAVIDSEYGSASKYADIFSFDSMQLKDDYNPQKYIEAITGAAEAGYEVIVCDSLTHSWNGTGGFLDLCDAEVKRMQARGQKPDSFAAWKVLTPLYNRLVDTIMSSPCHVIVTLRAKQEYEKVKGDDGKVRVQKVGMAPEMRDNFQFAMDIEGMLDMEHNFVIGKTRCPAINGKVFTNPGADLAKILLAWSSDGAPAEIDYKSLCRDLYQKLGAEKAEPIRGKHGEDWKAMYEEMKEVSNGLG